MLQVIESTPLLTAGVLVLGLLIGSFLNVVIIRYPARLEFQWRKDCAELLGSTCGLEDPEPPGIVLPPSSCRNCGHRIRAWENIPVISFALLRGRCAKCKTQIGFRYPLVELLTATVFLLVYLQFGVGWQCLAGMVFSAFLIALSGIDVDHQLLPDNLTLALLWIGLVTSVMPVFVTPSESIIGAVAGYGVLWIIYQLFRLITGKEGMGFGDFKLAAALGAWMGWEFLLLTIVLASLFGSLAGIVMLGLRKSARGQPVPFGPFLAIAGFITLLWGDVFVDTYLKFSGLQ